MSNRDDRQRSIRRVVRQDRVRTQKDLVDKLLEDGFKCTQATISRDIAVMGLEKVPEGFYVLPEDLHLRRMLSELVIDVVAAENLVVVKSMPGGAQGVAAALDAAHLEDLIGSIAGDDTILLISPDKVAAKEIVRAIGRYRT